ncbi:1-(5-phosphoribosyl)-5-[(5-phosphoribosylamino)methylideneamino]imidazole-4-carboxamide isomerase [Candidatus Micrarchaeota archaeon]|nr:1-(5-phosphoribosyl)-5-[(5-phosphoribosylamino)methylideneamino]imidazole-4-carboxamide isomerase [Candidatus Micrarchaeota archaeon]
MPNAFMLVIPAIDVLHGCCVRLFKGSYSRVTQYGDPLETVQTWVSAGARRIHVVDLDGAKQGEMKNFDLIKGMIQSADCEFEVGGGIRDVHTAMRIIHLGAKVIFGTVVVENPSLVHGIAREHGKQCIVSLDERDGKVQVRGWLKGSSENVFSVARGMERMGVSEIVFTSIERDGALVGPNFKMIKQMLETVSIPVIASGGVSTLEDLEKLKAAGVHGAIVGKALYEKKIDLKEAIEAIE